MADLPGSYKNIQTFLTKITLKPIKLTCPEAIYSPRFDTEIQVTLFVWPCKNSCLPSLILLRMIVHPRG